MVQFKRRDGCRLVMGENDLWVELLWYYQDRDTMTRVLGPLMTCVLLISFQRVGEYAD
jgi:hypothetical protein